MAPNRVHSLGVAPWKARFPQAEVWVSPRFSERHPQLPAERTLGTEEPPWSGQMDTLCFGGSAWFDEVVFHHRPSRTLILTDLVQRHDPALEGWFWRSVKSSIGVLGEEGGTARDLRGIYRDREAARASVEELLSWDFERVVISHGFNVLHDGKAYARKAFSWVFE